MTKPGAARNFPSDVKLAMAELYAAGKTGREIALLFDTTAWTVLSVVKQAGVPLRYTTWKLTDDQKVSLVAAYLNGETAASVAYRFNVTVGTVWKHVARRGSRL